MKFRKLVEVVEAEQITERQRVTVSAAGPFALTATTMAEPGEWLVTGALGDRWLCTDAVFRRLYAPLPGVEPRERP